MIDSLNLYTIHNEFSRVINGSCVILGTTTVLARMPGLNIVNAQNTATFAALDNSNA